MKKNYFLVVGFILITSLSKAQQLVDIYNGPNLTKSCLLVENNLYFSDETRVLKLDLTEPNPIPIVILDFLNRPVGLEFKDNFLYVAVFDDGEIIKLDLNNSSSTPQLVTSFGQSPNMLKFYGDFLYYSDNNDNAIYRYNLISNISESFISGVQGRPIGIEIRNDVLYYSEAIAGKISKISLTDANATPIEIISGLNRPIGIEFRNDELFIANAFQGKILKANVTESPIVVEEFVSNLTLPRDMTFLQNIIYVVHDTKISKVDLSLNVDDKSNNSLITLFPNPSNNYIQLSNLKAETVYNIYDINGRKLEQGNISTHNLIDISAFSNGCYLMKLDGISSPLRFIKN